MQNLLLGYRGNMRVEIEPGVPLSAKTVADLRALPTWPDGMVLNIHIDLDPPIEHCEGGTGILSTIGLPIRSPCRRANGWMKARQAPCLAVLITKSKLIVRQQRVTDKRAEDYQRYQPE